MKPKAANLSWQYNVLNSAVAELIKEVRIGYKEYELLETTQSLVRMSRTKTN